jgi:hypothetical protein
MVGMWQIKICHWRRLVDVFSVRPDDGRDPEALAALVLHRSHEGTANRARCMFDCADGAIFQSEPGLLLPSRQHEYVNHHVVCSHSSRRGRCSTPSPFLLKLFTVHWVLPTLHSCFQAGAKQKALQRAPCEPTLASLRRRTSADLTSSLFHFCAAEAKSTQLLDVRFAFSTPDALSKELRAELRELFTEAFCFNVPLEIALGVTKEEFYPFIDCQLVNSEKQKLVLVVVEKSTGLLAGACLCEDYSSPPPGLRPAVAAACQRSPCGVRTQR